MGVMDEESEEDELAGSGSKREISAEEEQPEAKRQKRSPVPTS